ncbi:MAG: diguanylate cyclase domain-containing protein [Fidelibacterota bacterium]
MAQVRHKILLTILLLAGSTLCAAGSKPVMERGVLRLGDWDLEQDGILDIVGEWEFYWQRFIAPEQFNVNHLIVPDGFIKAPGPWNDFQVGTHPIGGQGFATYHGRLRADQWPETVSFKFQSQATAYRVFINGDLVAEVGRVGRTRESTVPRYDPRTISYHPTTNQLDVVIQVSNFHHLQGGLWDTILLGVEPNIFAHDRKEVAVAILIAGSLIIMGLFYLAMYPMFRYEQSTLFLGLVSIVLGFRTMLTEEMTIHHFFPALSWFTTLRMEYLTLVLGIPFFMWYQYEVFKKDYSRRILFIVSGISLFYALLILGTSTQYFTGLLSYYLLFVLACLVYAIGVTFRAVHLNRDGATEFAIGLIIVAVAFINDTLNAFEIFTTGYYTSFAILIFIIVQAILLARRFIATFELVDQQNVELTRHREQLEHMVKDRTSRLEEVNKRLKELSVIDALTRIPNRRRLDEYMASEWSRMRRDKAPLSLIICDIDFFKKFNDFYGHQKGDDCLELVAQSLNETVHRPGDLVARYGGEEFCAVLPKTDLEGARMIGEAMRKAIEDLHYAHEKSTIIPVVTISVGVATVVPTLAYTVSDLLEAADQCLYKAKEEGRNRVCAVTLPERST